MNIFFLCGSLEIGRDGVGDYTNSLASALIELDHCISIIALNDKFVNDVIETTRDDKYKTLRLPSTLTLKTKLSIVKNWIKNSNPDWISIQYVPYSFNNKGLPWWLPKYLSKCINEKKVHIMFHETWVGTTKISPIKHKVYGFFQRNIARSLIYKLNPQVVTTTNFLYKEILKENGINSELLALFSNIPKVSIDIKNRRNLLSRFTFLDSLKGDEMIVGIFGTLHPKANLEHSIKELLVEAAQLRKKLVFISFGRAGAFGLTEFDRLKHVFRELVTFHYLGELSEENVSILFQILDKGISCTPIEHIGKSGVFAAMRFHGLEVLCPASDYMPEYDDRIKEFNRHLFAKPQSSWSVQAVSKKFSFLLSNS